MIQIPDCPWVRDAEINGYPVGGDTANPSVGDCPKMFIWEDDEHDYELD